MLRSPTLKLELVELNKTDFETYKAPARFIIADSYDRSWLYQNREDPEKSVRFVLSKIFQVPMKTISSNLVETFIENKDFLKYVSDVIKTKKHWFPLENTLFEQISTWYYRNISTASDPEKILIYTQNLGIDSKYLTPLEALAKLMSETDPSFSFDEIKQVKLQYVRDTEISNNLQEKKLASLKVTGILVQDNQKFVLVQGQIAESNPGEKSSLKPYYVLVR